MTLEDIRKEGFEAGKIEGLRNALTITLSAKTPLPEVLSDKISSIEDITTLETLIQKAVVSADVNDVLEKI